MKDHRMKAIIYTKQECSYCQKAKVLFLLKDIEHEEVQVGQDITREEFLTLFPEARTFPQIILEGNHIGGYNELTKLT